MTNDEPPPEILIHCYHGCWTFHVGSHEIPIRNGLYSDDVPASTVISEVYSILAHAGKGPVRVRWER